MAPGSLSYYIASLLFTSHLVYYFAIFTFQSIQQKYQKYLSYYLYQISLPQVTVKGLATPLSHWLRGSCLFVQVLGTCVLSPTRLIPWFSKTEGNTYATLLHHPFLFKGKPTHAQEVAAVQVVIRILF